VTWRELQRMFEQLDRLRLAMSRVDPQVGSAARERIERLAMNLEQAIDKGINETCVQMLRHDLERRQRGDS